MKIMQWYSLLNRGEESLMRRMDISKTEIPVCNEGNGFKEFRVFRGPLELYDFCINQRDDVRCLFEVIRGSLFQKIYFDIDIDLEGESKAFNHTREQRINIANQIPYFLIDCLIKTRPEIRDIDIMVFSSNSINKRSYHFIVDRWCVQNAKQNRKFFECVMALIPVPWRQYFDSSMYKSIQQFRLYMSTKYGKGRMKTLDPKYSTWIPDEGITAVECNRQVFLCSLVTRTDNCYILPFDEDDEEEIEYDTIDIDDTDALKLYSIIKSMPYAGCFSIVERKNNLVIMKRLLPSFCSICDTTHDNENPCVLVSPNGNVNLDCRRHPERKRLFLGNIFDDAVQTGGSTIELDIESVEVPFFDVKMNRITDSSVSTSSSPEISVNNDSSTSSLSRSSSTSSFSISSPLSVSSGFSTISPTTIAGYFSETQKKVPNKYAKKGQLLVDQRKKRNHVGTSFATLI